MSVSSLKQPLVLLLLSVSSKEFLSGAAESTLGRTDLDWTRFYFEGSGEACAGRPAESRLLSR